MKNITIILFIILIIFLALFFNYKNSNVKKTNEKFKEIDRSQYNDVSFRLYDKTNLTHNGQNITLYIADDNQKKQKGLMNVSKLNNNEGMIFLFAANAKHTFWMKNTLIPLDIIWVDDNKVVVDIAKNAEPCTTTACPYLYPIDNARYVIELQGGYTDKNSLKVGDLLNFKLEL